MEADCKSAGSAYGGSNPSLPIDKLFGLPYNLSHRGVSSAVERYPSKLDVVGSIPILRFGDSSPILPISLLLMKMWETKCSDCGKTVPANKCPQLYTVPLCKPCWLKAQKPNPV